MPWTRLDDGLDEHRKVEALIEENELRGLAAVGLWVLTLTNSNRRLTNGEVSTTTLRKIAPRHGPGLAARLAEVGLYDDGYAIHDYLDYNPSRSSVEEKRRKDSERKAQGRSHRNPNGFHAESTRNPSGVRLESARPNPIPSPIPTTTEQKDPPSSSVAKGRA